MKGKNSLFPVTSSADSDPVEHSERLQGDRPHYFFMPFSVPHFGVRVVSFREAFRPPYQHRPVKQRASLPQTSILQRVDFAGQPQWAKRRGASGRKDGAVAGSAVRLRRLRFQHRFHRLQGAFAWVRLFRRVRYLPTRGVSPILGDVCR